MITIKDVARLANVSVSSASRALRGEGYVSAKTKADVLKAAYTLKYTPDLQAKGLRLKRSNIIGIIVSDINNYFYNTVLSKLEAELKKLGYMVLLSYSCESSQEETQNLELLLASRVDGIIFTPVDNTNQKMIKLIQEHNIPLLQLYRKAYSDIDSLVVDDEYGAYLATQHLLQSGHERILLITVDSLISPSRTTGYVNALREHGVRYDKNCVLECPLNSESGTIIVNKIKAVAPTAIIAGTNTLGLNAFIACMSLKKSIPNDISLVVFDDIPWISALNLTAIAQPITVIARTAISILHGKIESSHDTQSFEQLLPSHVKIQPSLNIRSSVIGVEKPNEI